MAHHICEHGQAPYLNGCLQCRYKKDLQKIFKNNMEPHTNLTNEITGAYYERTRIKIDGFSVFFGTLAAIVTIVIIGAVLLSVADKIVGAEQVTYWIANLVG